MTRRAGSRANRRKSAAGSSPAQVSKSWIARAGLGDEVGGLGDDERVEQRVGQVRLREDHPLPVPEGARALPLDEVRRQCERCAAEADQRHAAVERAPEDADRLVDVGEILLGLVGLQRVDGGARAHRRVDHGAGHERERQAHRGSRDEQVGEEDRRIDAEPVDRLDRHLRREIGGRAQGHEVHAAADLAVLGKVAPRLPHQPDGRPGNGFFPAGAEEQVGGRAHAVTRRAATSRWSRAA